VNESLAGFKKYQSDLAGAGRAHRFDYAKAQKINFEKTVDSAYHKHYGDASGIPSINSCILSQLFAST
jgi:hypothetical protein